MFFHCHFTVSVGNFAASAFTIFFFFYSEPISGGYKILREREHGLLSGKSVWFTAGGTEWSSLCQLVYVIVHVPKSVLPYVCCVSLSLCAFICACVLAKAWSADRQENLLADSPQTSDKAVYQCTVTCSRSPHTYTKKDSVSTNMAKQCNRRSLSLTHTLGKNINHCQSKHYSAAGCSVINSTVEESLLLFTLHCLCTFIFDSQQASRLNTDFVCFLQCSTHKKIFYLNSFQFHLTCSNGIFHDSICFPKHTNATSI